MAVKTFLRNSVASIPFVSFLLGLSLQDYKLLALSFGLGLSGIGNWLLKKCFPNNLRPVGARGCSACNDELSVSEEPGFPSGHSQNAWFFSTYMLCYSLSVASRNQNKEILIVTTVIYITLATSISLSRLGISPVLGNLCHTPQQVIAGAVLGIISGALYYGLVLRLFF